MGSFFTLLSRLTQTISSTLLPASQEPTNSFPLSSLPAELLEKILLNIIPTLNFLPLGPSPYSGLDEDYPSIKNIQLAQVSRLLRRESLRMYYSRNSFSVALAPGNFWAVVGWFDESFGDERAMFVKQGWVKDGEFLVLIPFFPPEDVEGEGDGEVPQRMKQGGGMYKAFSLEHLSSGTGTVERDDRVDWVKVEEVWRSIRKCRGEFGKEDSGLRRRFIGRLLISAGRALGLKGLDGDEVLEGRLGRLCAWEVDERVDELLEGG